MAYCFIWCTAGLGFSFLQYCLSQVQIRPWRLADADYVVEATMALDPRKTVFVGGVPRPLKAGMFAILSPRETQGRVAKYRIFLSCNG